jgi:hypothetical protein
MAKTKKVNKKQQVFKKLKIIETQVKNLEEIVYSFEGREMPTSVYNRCVLSILLLIEARFALVNDYLFDAD